jgi:hypothetical protein
VSRVLAAVLALALPCPVVAQARCAPATAKLVRFEPAALEAGRRVLRVGPGEKLATPGLAARVARDGDAVLIEAADYPDSGAVWPQDRLLLRGVDGRPHLIAGPKLAQGKAIWVINGDDVVVENVEFSNARIPSHNGAGIRMQDARLTIRAGVFHDSDMGILTDNDPTHELLIEFSEFARNGHASGQAHNLYVGSIGRFEIRYSSSYGAKAGHLLKSRARRNVVAYNQLADSPSGPSSYELDFPRSTDTTVIGNLILQAETSPNQAMLTFGAEDKGRPPLGRLRIAWNTFVSLRPNPVFIFNHSAEPALIVGNLFAGAVGKQVRGPAESHGNGTVARSVFADPDGLDFRLRPDELASLAVPEGSLDVPADLRPQHEYVQPASGRPRATASLRFPGGFGVCGHAM